MWKRHRFEDRSTQLENYSGIQAPRGRDTHTQNCELPGSDTGRHLDSAVP